MRNREGLGENRKMSEMSGPCLLKKKIEAILNFNEILNALNIFNIFKAIKYL